MPLPRPLLSEASGSGGWRRSYQGRCRPDRRMRRLRPSPPAGSPRAEAGRGCRRPPSPASARWRRSRSRAGSDDSKWAWAEAIPAVIASSASTAKKPARCDEISRPWLCLPITQKLVSTRRRPPSQDDGRWAANDERWALYRSPLSSIVHTQSGVLFRPACRSGGAAFGRRVSGAARSPDWEAHQHHHRHRQQGEQ